MNFEKETGNILACKICRCRFYTIPYITCPYEIKWICGCENMDRSDAEMEKNKIYLMKEELMIRVRQQ